MRRPLLIAACGATAATLACSLVFPISDEAASLGEGRVTDGEGGAGSGGDPGRGDDGSTGTPSDDGGAVTLRCPQTGRGAELVPAGPRLCIDATPTTRDQYAAFLAAKVPTSGQLPGCELNTSFTPAGASDGGTVPVHGVDWCDAWAFCAWAGKRLCGGFPDVELPELDAGADAGFAHGLSHTDVTVRAASAFAWACQGGDRALTYPYGYDLDPEQCYGMPRTPFPPLHPGPGPVGAFGCEGGFPGIFDMVGNVAEWVDACQNNSCALLGNSACRSLDLQNRTIQPELYKDGVGPRIGFRCCGTTAPSP